MLKVNMGCGSEKLKGFLNVDDDSSVKPDLVLDVTGTLPWGNNTVDYIFSRCFWEHTGDEFFNMIREWWRVSKSGAIWQIIVPNVDHHGAFQDPTHKRFFCLESFDYFDKEHDRWKNFGRRYGIPGFKIRNKLVRGPKGKYVVCELEVMK